MIYKYTYYSERAVALENIFSENNIDTEQYRLVKLRIEDGGQQSS